jgi:Domain of unknown function (DUF1707)
MRHHRSHHRSVRPSAAPPAPSGPVRVSDADRERVVELLRGHTADGRLDAGELEERLERAYAARYGSELQAVLAELPAEPEPPRRSVQRPRPHIAPFVLVLAVAALIGAGALTGAWWLLWLIWPLAAVLGPRHHRHSGTRA